MKFQQKKLSTSTLLYLYKAMLYPRMIEERMLLLLRQGKISKWFSGIGQEATSVGVTAALKEDEFIFPMHRNLGVFTTRGIALEQLFAQWQGKSGGFTKGRDRSFHFGTKQHHIVGMISHLGPQLSLASGVALTHVLKKEGKVAVAFTGEGGTSEGEFHEALNVAAVWSLPVIFIIENNGYALSTPTKEQFACDKLIHKGIGYGIEAKRIDGNNVIEVYRTIRKYAKMLRKEPRPILIESMTFRMRGHEEASGTKYVPKELMDHWAQRDPINNYEEFLLRKEMISHEQIDAIKKEFQEDILDQLKRSFDHPPVMSSADDELADVYASAEAVARTPQNDKAQEIRYVDAIKQGLHHAMSSNDRLVIMGQDVGEYGGVFKITEGFIQEFGKDRVRNTPLCESAILGMAMGMTFSGFQAIVEMQFADFVTCGFNQIVNNIAKTHYRWGHSVNVVIRMPSGGNVGAGPFHSQSTEAWFMHCPGLKIVFPSSPFDAKGLLLGAIEDPNPVIFFEHKFLYRTQKDLVPVEDYTLPIGQAKLIQEGEEVSIITYGLGVHWAKQVIEETGIKADIVDLRTLLPYDKEAIINSVKKCGKALVLSESSEIAGVASEIAAFIQENCFEFLDAPVVRCSSLATPVPFDSALEKQYMASHHLNEKLSYLINY